MKTPLRIGDLAEHLDLTPRTLRYWEERGLIPEAERTDGGYRAYGEAHLRAASGVLALKGAGLPLRAIRGMQERLDEADTALAGFERLDGALARHQERLAERIAALQELHDALSQTRAALSTCDGCHGKALDGACPPCLSQSTGRPLPDVLVSLLRARHEVSR